MIFNSPKFALFFTLVFFLYYFVFKKKAKTQNLLLLVTSIFFYSLVSWKFVVLLAFSGTLNYYLAKIIANKKVERTKKFLFIGGISFNIGILFYFKYFNFFIINFVQLFNFIGITNSNFTALNILLPIGVSFYTFQLIGYLIDVYNEEIEPTNDLLSFLTYLAYFPKLLSGPIERVQQFLPQIQKEREFNYTLAIDGLKQFVWGMLKKVVIANNSTILVDQIFNNHQESSGSILLLGAIAYIISLYADFSGFTDMACGVSKILNIKITNNFAFPFFTTNISDFWKRWHISLTSWLLDYVYTPLSFVMRKFKKAGTIISIIITFLLVGIWHGANWTYVLFGLLHGIYFIPIVIKGNMFTSSLSSGIFPSTKEFFGMISLFVLVALTAVLFKASNTIEAFSYFSVLFSKSLFTVPNIHALITDGIHPFLLLILIVLFFSIEWFGRKGEYAIAHVGSIRSNFLRYSIYFALILVILFFKGGYQQFIYFQF